MGNTCKADQTGQIAEKSHCKSILFIAAQKEQCYTQTTSKGKTRIEGGVKNATAKDKNGRFEESPEAWNAMAAILAISAKQLSTVFADPSGAFVRDPFFVCADVWHSNCI
ncbi:MAG: hypothetical protein PUD50_06760 [Eubacteriales bacterium]|nr:hypothetical protein [Eubacteriales bacterium]